MGSLLAWLEMNKFLSPYDRVHVFSFFLYPCLRWDSPHQPPSSSFPSVSSERKNNFSIFIKCGPCRWLPCNHSSFTCISKTIHPITSPSPRVSHTFMPCSGEQRSTPMSANKVHCESNAVPSVRACTGSDMSRMGTTYVRYNTTDSVDTCTHHPFPQICS